MTGNRNPKTSVVPDLHHSTSVIQKFVRDLRTIHTKTVAQDVVDCCIKNGFIAINCDPSSPEICSKILEVKRIPSWKEERNNVLQAPSEEHS
uniref:Uncharacterized protein n=1 Tax=Octopus bimaculoides TaxID=37653 RepID=A0A0L8FKK9_OCTBM